MLESMVTYYLRQLVHMKNIVEMLIRLLLLKMCHFSIKNAMIIDSITQNEINNRLDVEGAMGGEITLMSNMTIGTGAFAFVLAGETEDKTSVAIKVMSKYTIHYHREYNCYEKMDAMTDQECEKYGIPFIYHFGEFSHYKTMAMTMLDTDLLSLRKKFGSFSKDTIVIFSRDMVKTLKFMHSKGIINQDIKPDNIMTKRANVYLCDFNQGDEKAARNIPSSGSRYFRSIALHLGEPPAEYDDMQSLFYSMLLMADIDLPWMKLKIENEILAFKQRITDVEKLCEQLKYPELIKPFKIFYKEAIESMQQKRLPKYDILYKMFDDALYNGRNRSQRIVFEWLTVEERAVAMVEEVTSIESIVFPKKDAHKSSHRIVRSLDRLNLLRNHPEYTKMS